MITGRVNRILLSSAVDGPGNRLVIFLQGCNFACRYCHNPETANLCRGCGDCVSACRHGALRRTAAGVQFAPDRCRNCGRCLARCRHGSSPRTRLVTFGEVRALLRRNRRFISGITLSGGEASLQPAFVVAVARAARALGLTAFLDTNGNMTPAVRRKLLPALTAAMVDLKAFRPADHRRLTGSADNTRVLATIRAAARAGKLHEVRTVVVPGLINNARNIALTARFLAALPRPPRFILIPFRRAGTRGAARHYREPRPELLKKLAAGARRAGVKDVNIL